MVCIAQGMGAIEPIIRLPIVTTAGVTRGALYHHFDGKKGLFRAVLNQVQTEIEKRVKIAVEQVQDPMEMLIAGNNEFLAACLDPGL
jgi:AcrR family transcriptional regulator